MKTFALASSLEASPNKTALYFGIVNEDMQASIIQVTGSQKGEFLFRYLGVPITCRRLTKCDCDVLVDKMMKRITYWSSRSIPFICG